VALGTPPALAAIAADAIVEVWVAGRPFVRAHSHAFGSTEFDERLGASARWSPVRTRAGDLVPVVYAGGDDFAAAAETVFRYREDGSRPPRVPLGRYASWGWSTVACRHDLALVELAGDGLDALGVTSVDLLGGGPSTYPATHRWAVALLTALPEVDGIVWQSRQADGRDAIALFGSCRSRAGPGREDLEALGPTIPFATPPGLQRLRQIASAIGSTVVSP
jgi:hypothetical protein